jgi:hypothetical protein
LFVPDALRYPCCGIVNTQLALLALVLALVLLLVLLVLLLPMMTALLRTAGNVGDDLTPFPHSKGPRAYAALTGSNRPAIVLASGVGSRCRCMKRCASIMLHSSNTFEQVGPNGRQY